MAVKLVYTCTFSLANHHNILAAECLDPQLEREISTCSESLRLFTSIESAKSLCLPNQQLKAYVRKKISGTQHSWSATSTRSALVQVYSAVNVKTNSLLFQCWILIQMTTNSFPHHRILAHQHNYKIKHSKLECGPMPNLMAALPNICGALCSTPQSLADAHY